MPTCKICDTAHRAKKTWNTDYGMCRMCLYFIEFFSFNGNYLSEYY